MAALDTLLRNGFRRGVLGGSRPWLAVGVAAGVVRVLRRLARPDLETVYTTKLAPGETITIENRPRERRQ